MKDTHDLAATPALVQAVQTLLEAHRPAFGQARVYRRAVGLLWGELFNFGRHTVTQGLLSLGLTDGDWSAWYRLFSRARFREAAVAERLLQATLVSVPAEAPYVVGVDGTQVPRSSRKMPGTSWLKAPRTPVFYTGIHRAQRFVHGAWLTPMDDGYSRAVPLRFLPAFPPKAVPAAGTPPRREWEAGHAFLQWVRGQLDQAGRQQQLVLTLADGAYDTLEFWRGLPARVALAVRTARNRALFWLPQRQPGPGRPPSYGARAPSPREWLHQPGSVWQKRELRVRGRFIPLRFRVEGPFLREGLPARPLFLIVVKGMHRRVGTRVQRFQHRPPAFYLVSAWPQGAGWRLPLPIEALLGWLWQRWELEVAHREMKSGLGVGEKQCWQPQATQASVQWNVWVYAVLVLAGYRTWGLCHGPPVPTRWWRGAGRWSLGTLWRAYRAALWSPPQFRPLWTATGDNWLQQDTWLTALHNASLAASRL